MPSQVDPLLAWKSLVAFVNNKPTLFGMVGVRDPDYPCEEYDAKNYDGTGDCLSDGHYECVNCSKLSPKAHRFEEHGLEGRADRLRFYWARKRP